MIKIFDPNDKMRRYWRLDDGTYIVGRNADCDLVIDNDTISRKHARLEISADGSATITDLNSHNGIVINGISVEDTAELNHNDTIELGRVVLKFVASANSADLGVSVKLKEDDGLSNITMFSMEKALKSIPSNILENPRVFNSFFEFGKMLIKPGENEEWRRTIRRADRTGIRFQSLAPY
jgi:pSer/pThr/pTyr-binding forkhead associated (FHA) protein